MTKNSYNERPETTDGHAESIIGLLVKDSPKTAGLYTKLIGRERPDWIIRNIALAMLCAKRKGTTLP
jgi:hypothetical protein